MALFSLLALAFFASAQTPAEISLNLKADTFFVHAGETFTVTFELKNPMPAGDNVIERMDVDLLRLKDAGLSVQSWQENDGWKHSFDAKFNDDKFFITNATSQPLVITLKAGSNVKTSSILGSFMFQKLSGTQFLKTPTEFTIKVNALAAGQPSQPPTTTAKSTEQDIMIMALIAVIIALAAALAFMLLRSRKHERHAKKH